VCAKFCEMVTEPCVKIVPVTVCEMQTVQCIRRVPVKVCRQVCETQTIHCPVTIPRHVTEMKPVCVSRTICRQVPVEVCVKVPVTIHCPPVVIPSAQSVVASGQSLPLSTLPPYDPGDHRYPLFSRRPTVLH